MKSNKIAFVLWDTCIHLCKRMNNILDSFTCKREREKYQLRNYLSYKLKSSLNTNDITG